MVLNRFLVVVLVRMTRRRHLRQVVVLLVFAESGQGQGQAEIVGLVLAAAAARVVVVIFVLIIIMQRRPPFPFRLRPFRGGVLVSVLDSQVGQRIQIGTELSPLFDRRRRDESRIVLCDLGKRFEAVRAEWGQPARGSGAAR